MLDIILLHMYTISTICIVFNVSERISRWLFHLLISYDKESVDQNIFPTNIVINYSALIFEDYNFIQLKVIRVLSRIYQTKLSKSKID